LVVSGGVSLRHSTTRRARSPRRSQREWGTLYIPERSAETGWTPEQLALLGTLPDEEVAERTGRTPGAIRVKRSNLRIPSACDRRRKEHRG
jgi:hypothetical protein